MHWGWGIFDRNFEEFSAGIDICTDAAGVPPAYSRVAQTAQSVIGATYTFGAKGYDGGANGSKTFVAPDSILSAGYYYYDGSTARAWTFGRGLDCSGLTMWSYNRTFFSGQTVNWNTCLSSRKCPVFQEGAHGQYDANTQRITAQEVRIGDLLFFDECIGSAASCLRGQDEIMDHVAMFVDSFRSDDGRTYNAVHASGFAGTVVPAIFDPAAQTLSTTRPSDMRTQTLHVAAYGRVSDPRLDAWVVTNSPVHMAIIDPEGILVTYENSLLNDDGHTREVSGMYYMVKEVVEGATDDTVAIPRLKTGTYFIDVEPKSNASPSDVFSLEVRLPGSTIVLAEHAAIQDETKRSFAFEMGNEGVVESLRALIDIKPGDAIACIEPESKGNTPIAVLGSIAVNVQRIVQDTVELDRDSDPATKGLRPVRWSTDTDVNGDGILDLVLHFATPKVSAAGLLEDAQRVFLTGQYWDGRTVAGTDIVYVVGSAHCR